MSYLPDFSVLRKDGIEEFTFSFIHLFSGFIVAEGKCDCIQLIEGDARFEEVLTGIPLSGEFSPCFMGERFLAERLLPDRSVDDLLLYDRLPVIYDVHLASVFADTLLYAPGQEPQPCG